MALVTGSIPPLTPDPLRLRQRLALQGGGFALFLLGAFSGSLYWGITQQWAADQRAELVQLAATAAAQLPLIAHETHEAEGSAKFRPGRRGITVPGLERQRVQWFDAEGRLLSGQGTLPVPPPPAGPLPGPVGSRWQRWPGGSGLWQVVLSRDPAAEGPRRERLGFVRVALSDRAAREDLARLRRGLLLGGIVTALAALLVGRRMLRAAFLPLQRQLRALQRFTADASHEQRHPLTALRTQLAAMPPELRRQPGLAWSELDRLSERMGDLLDDLLFLARMEQAGLEGAAGPEELQAFDVLELLEDLLRCYAPQAAALAVRLRLTPSPEHHRVPVRARSAQLLRLFTNLLLNAIRHSPPGGTVAVEVRTAGRQVWVAVADEGPGIPPGERQRVFDRFWRGSDRGGQSGLGLAIAQAIARRHGGSLRVGESGDDSESAEGGGGCVLLVELPIAAPIS
ncbi:MAG: HAMP domain-containing sensor histidine kinase [Cyanobacteriota bacterium]|nr:HAMP domain-containing sensor histidine kinase [Cyanobacteriota bacterium]